MSASQAKKTTCARLYPIEFMDKNKLGCAQSSLCVLALTMPDPVITI
ncbi:uncharacterized protein METZ01_LOCUS315393 [marine metagenome]|uniref:Uncharacterized protein n=1 Tax=marine metagenome TaxID=408172 RepID=A0A382NMV5_9ZZZZ